MNNFYIIAHRGVTENGLKENTKESLTAIKSIKTDIKLGIEFDIQITLDNKIIIFHDEEIDKKIIEQTTYSEILEIDNDIIELEEILKEFDNTKFLLNIELKNYSNKINRLKLFIKLTKEIIARYDINFYFSSFDREICSNLENCYYISEEINDKNVDITEYNCLKNYDNLVGVYTLYDNNNFNLLFIDEVLSKKIIYLITDNVEKLINYLYKD